MSVLWGSMDDKKTDYAIISMGTMFSHHAMASTKKYGFCRVEWTSEILSK